MYALAGYQFEINRRPNDRIALFQTWNIKKKKKKNEGNIQEIDDKGIE